jgi:cell division inhibitor SepF
MEELVLQEKPGIFTRIGGLFTRVVDDEEEEAGDPKPLKNTSGPVRGAHRYMVTVRRQINSFDDAMAAAIGLKRGEQQILNLSATETGMRQKIVDFMCGVNFAQEGTWEEIGEGIYLICPGCAYVEVAPATPRGNATKN